MIYLLQPEHYPDTFQRLIRLYLQYHQITDQLIVSSTEPYAVTLHQSYYFIISDKLFKDWSALQIARSIRQKFPNSPLIFIGDEIDYQELFRSHLEFLDVISSRDPNPDLEECLDYLYRINASKNL